MKISSIVKTYFHLVISHFTRFLIKTLQSGLKFSSSLKIHNKLTNLYEPRSSTRSYELCWLIAQNSSRDNKHYVKNRLSSVVCYCMLVSLTCVPLEFSTLSSEPDTADSAWRSQVMAQTTLIQEVTTALHDLLDSSPNSTTTKGRKLIRL